jgi:phosphohistidine phosphatase
MATHLWLLRHGEAVPHDARADDGDRELTPKGERQSRNAGRALARMSLELDACYASPKVRARDTARLAAAELGVEVVEDRSVAAGFGRAEAETLLAAHEGHVLVVGHNPDFAQLVHDLTGARADFMKGGVAAIRMGSAPQLLVLLRPTELIAMAG